MRGPRAANGALPGFVALAVLFHLFGLASSVAAEPRTPEGRLPFHTYGPEVGFGRWSVHAITQGTDGAMWIGTDGGLYRYDGERITPVDLPSQSPFVYDLAPAPGGGLWCWTRGGAFYGEGGRFRPFDIVPAHTDARTAVTDHDGRVWMGSNRGLLQEVAPGRMDLVPGWSFGTVDVVAMDASGNIIALGPEALVVLRSDGSYQRWGAEAGLAPEQYRKVQRDGAGRFWFISLHQLWRLDPETGVVDLVRRAEDDFRFEDLIADPEGGVWLASPQTLLHVGVDEDEPVEVHGVPGGRALALYVDREGSLWVGGDGLHRAKSRGLIRVHGQDEGLPAHVTWATRRDAVGRLWVGTARGLARAVGGDRWEPVPGIPEVPIVNLALASDGSLWLGGNTPDVLRWTPETKVLDRFFLDMPKTIAPTVYALAFDGEGALWAGTRAGVYRGTAEPSPRFAPVAMPGIDEPVLITDVRTDTLGRLWIASAEGLFLREGESYRRFTEEHGLRHQTTFALAERRPGEICVGYLSVVAVTCFREEGHVLRDVVHFDEQSGLPRSTVYMIGADVAGRLWIGTGRGLVLVEDDRVIDAFTVDDGLPSDDISAWSFLAEPHGDVWIGTSMGLARFHGARYRKPPPPPSVLLAAARGGGRDLLGASGVVELEDHESDLELHFMIPAYVNEARVELDARLVGADEGFREEDSRRLRYRGLRPGSYRVEARARYRPGAFGPVFTLGFTVLPPFWQTWWFRMLALLGVFGSVALVVHVRQRRLRLRNAELEALVAERTRALRAAQARLVALEREATEQQMAGGFAHEIRNALVGARMLLARVEGATGDGRSLCEKNAAILEEMYLGLRDKLDKPDRAWLGKRIKEMNANEAALDETLNTTGVHLGRAFGLTRQLLDYAQLGRERSGTEPVQMRPLVVGIVESLRGERDAGIEVDVRVPEDATIPGAESHFRSIVENLARNAFDAILEREGDGPRRLSIALEGGSEGWVLRVEDTGVGIAPPHRARIFEPFFSTKPQTGTGLGLGVVRKLVGLYGGTIRVESEFGRGTCFVIELPRREGVTDAGASSRTG